MEKRVGIYFTKDELGGREDCEGETYFITEVYTAV